MIVWLLDWLLKVFLISRKKKSNKSENNRKTPEDTLNYYTICSQPCRAMAIVFVANVGSTASETLAIYVTASSGVTTSSYSATTTGSDWRSGRSVCSRFARNSRNDRIVKLANWSTKDAERKMLNPRERDEKVPGQELSYHVIVDDAGSLRRVQAPRASL